MIVTKSLLFAAERQPHIFLAIALALFATSCIEPSIEESNQRSPNSDSNFSFHYKELNGIDSLVIKNGSNNLSVLTREIEPIQRKLPDSEWLVYFCAVWNSHELEALNEVSQVADAEVDPIDWARNKVE